MDGPAHQSSKEWINAYRGLQALASRCATGADDDLQDAALAALHQQTDVRDKRAWLRLVARNRSRARVRRSATWQQVLRALPAVQAQARPDECAAHAEFIARLHHALASLDARLRETLVLRFFAGLSTREIAEHHGCPHGTARWRVHEGLRRIRVELDREGGRAAWLRSVVPFLSTPLPASPPSSTLSTFGTIIMITTSLSLAAAAALFVTSPRTPVPDTKTAPSIQAHDFTAASRPVTKTPSHWAPRPRPASPLMSAATVKTKTETKTKTKTKPLNQPGTLYTEQDCADAVTMYNESEGDPEAGDYLLEASECFENLGHYGKSIKVLTVLHEREANTARKKDGRKRLVAVFETLLDPDRGDVGPAGAACLAPLEETDAAALAVERLAAADCLHASLLVASAIRQRELAGPHLAEAERALNATTLQELKELAATLRTLRTDALGPHDATTESPGP